MILTSPTPHHREGIGIHPGNTLGLAGGLARGDRQSIPPAGRADTIGTFEAPCSLQRLEGTTDLVLGMYNGYIRAQNQESIAWFLT